MKTSVRKSTVLIAPFGNQYHFEYMALHNQRMALVRLVHVWNQIGISGSVVVFGATLSIAAGQNAIHMIAIGGGLFLSILLLLFARWVGRAFDRALVDLYPRIIALELMLDYQYYRTYLKSVDAFSQFVFECETITNVTNTSYVWKEVMRLFEKFGGYSAKGRFVIELDIMAGILIITYLVISIAVLWQSSPHLVSSLLKWGFILPLLA